MKAIRLAALLLAIVWGAPALAQVPPPVSIDSPQGQVTAGKYVALDGCTFDTPVPNLLSLDDTSCAVTPPSLAAGKCKIADTDAGAGETWQILCDGVALTIADLMEGPLIDADIPDTITASNYLPLAGGTLTGQLQTDNLGIEFADSDTNPTCAASNYNIFADLSEGLLKKCNNGTASDLHAIHIFEGATDKGWLGALTFDSTGFTVTGTTVALGTSVSLLGQTISMSETTFTAGAGIAFSTDDIRTASTEAGFLADGGATGLTCGASNQGKMQVLDDGTTEVCDGATTSVKQVLTNKTYVDARYHVRMGAAPIQGTANAFSTTLRFFNAGTGTTALSLTETTTQEAINTTCVAQNFKVYVTRFGAWPTSATFTITLRKNQSSSGELSVNLNALAGTSTVLTTASTLSYTAGDTFGFTVQCSGTCTDAASIVYFRPSFDCIAS